MRVRFGLDRTQVVSEVAARSRLLRRRELGVSDLERAALLATARAYLEWELEVSGFGVPQLSLRARTASESASAAEDAAPMPADSVPSASAAGPTTSAPAARAMPRVEAGSAARAEDTPDSRVQPEARATLASLATLPSVEVTGDRRARLTQIDAEVRACSRCELAKGRTHTVFARGNPDSPLVFIGEGPGQEEDRTGQPFVGPAGQLLDRMVAAMGFARDDVYICNVVKCRPPGNRTPLPSEAGACAPYLLGQLDAVRPKVIVALGRCATENLGLVGAGGGWRGRWGKFRGVDVMPTYHPAFLLRSPEFKRPVWEDLQKVMSRLTQVG